MPIEFASQRIAVFTKVPRQGHSKSRLATSIGVEAAQDCYDQLLSHTLTTAMTFQAEIWYDGIMDDSAWTKNLRTYKQCEGGLGERMFSVFRTGCRLLIGCDCPVVSVAYLNDAFKQLEQSDLVLGPVEDGGYFLIGMNQPHEEMFHGISWSTGAVLAETIQKADSLNLAVACLPTLWDVDTVSDYNRWIKLRRDSTLTIST